VRIGLGSDHVGFLLKERVRTHCGTRGIPVSDFGAYSETPTDYPDIAVVVGEAVRQGAVDRAVLVCGTGLGMAIAASKLPGVYAAPVCDVETARSARASNNTQIITLGARNVPADLACAIVDAWLHTEFRGGRSARKVAKIAAIERRYLQGTQVDWQSRSWAC